MADKKPSAVSDSRFQKVHNDPRFARLSNKKNKLKIDKRFAAVLKDERFQSVQGKYDKYGRRIDRKSNELKKFYDLEEEDEQEDKSASSSSDDEDSDKEAAAPAKAKAKAKTKPTSDDDSESDDDEAPAAGDEKMSRLDYLNRMARGELESGSDTSDDSDDSDADAYMEEDEEEEKEDIPMGDETKRFAVMNCDWSRIRAVDLFALFQSFAPATGAVKDVTIYPSDYGLEKMKEEEQYGPRSLWADDKKKTDKEGGGSGDEDDDEDDDASEGKPEEEEDKDEGEEEEEEDDDPLGVKKSVTAAEADGFDVEKLRKYELQKLKYYYAVVTCDSVKTAAAIYENCDQLEYETSSNLLDLRFIPDEMAFANAPKESCQGVPETYKPAIFATMALQNTDVKLTWEEDDDHRMELLTRQSDWKNAQDDDFAAYLASENSSSEEEDDDSQDSEKEEEEEEAKGNAKGRKKAAKIKKLKNRYRKMLLGSDAEDSDDAEPAGMDSDDNDEDADAASEDDGNMEMSFTLGAGDILKAKRQKELEASETPFERYIREKKQEKNKKRHEKRALQKEQQRETKAVLQKKGKAAPAQLQALRAAIDGDSDDGGDDAGDDDADRNFDMKKIAHQDKIAKLKGKRKAKELKKLAAKNKSGLQEGFAFDAADPRFSAMYNKGSQFQLDPTDPKFKKTDATQAIFQERRKRKAQPLSSASAPTKADAADAEGKKGADLKAMVENLKRKAPPTKSAPKPFKKSKQ